MIVGGPTHSVHLRFRRGGANGQVGICLEGAGVKFTVQYLGVPQATVRYASELDAESVHAAETSAKIGLPWAEKEHGCCCYRVIDEAGAVVANGPSAERMARCRDAGAIN
jgi:hypothetical protein